MGVVSVQKVVSYEKSLLDKAIAKHFEALDVAADLFDGMKVVLKPNLLSARKPEDAVTTHPLLIQAVIDWFIAHGVEHIVVADSPGGPYTESWLSSVYNASGMTTLVGAKLNHDFGFSAVAAPSGVVCQSFNLINPITAADYIVDIAKLKTHALTVFSAGTKNIFGCVPGLQKPEFHYRFPDQEDFVEMLLDLAETVKPNVIIIDAIEGMEGDGPGSGTVKELGFVLASRDIYGQDRYAAELIGIDPETVPLLRHASDRGLITTDEIEIVGEPSPEPVPFKLPKTVKPMIAFAALAKLPRPVLDATFKLLATKPIVHKDRCIGCGRCAESCPPHTIAIVKHKAVINRKKCISCFCCQEMCPVKAIDSRRF